MDASDFNRADENGARDPNRRRHRHNETHGPFFHSVSLAGKTNPLNRRLEHVPGPNLTSDMMRIHLVDTQPSNRISPVVGMAGESLERGKKAFAGEGNVSGFDLRGVAFGQVPRNGGGGELICGEPEPEAGEFFIEEMNAIDFHWLKVSQARRRKKRPPRTLAKSGDGPFNDFCLPSQAPTPAGQAILQWLLPHQKHQPEC